MRNLSRQLMAAACLVAMPAISAPANSQVPDPAQVFAVATAEYATMHRRIETRLGGNTLNASATDIVGRVTELSTAIRAERGVLKQGSLFAPPLAAELRRRIASVLTARGLSAADVAADEIPEGVNRQSLALSVGGPFPWIVGSTTLPCIIEVLPPLPPELQYRFVFRDLALVDVHANMVIDVVRDALPVSEF